MQDPVQQYESEILTLVAEGKTTVRELMAALKLRAPGDRKLARYALKRARNEGRLLVDAKDQLSLPGAPDVES